MANTIKIKRGSGAPSSLEYGELGVSSSNVLYVGDSDGSVQELNTLDALDAMSRTNPTGTGFFSLNRKADTGVGSYSFAEGYGNEASGSASHAEGNGSIASGAYSHAEGIGATASGSASHAEGSWTTASGNYSHSEGGNTTASGSASHAEGSWTTASSAYSHSEGGHTTASGWGGSHAEGYYTTASGDYSHSEGWHTEAIGKSQHTQGKYNILDTLDSETAYSTYSHIVGNGTSDSARSNAHTLDWDGNAWFAGDVYVGSTSGTNKDDGSKKLVTYDDVYPIGSIYMSTSSTSPASMFGGTWQQITERFLFAASQLNEDGTVNEDATYPAGKVDGAATVQLTINEMPSHSHTLIRPKWYNSDNYYGENSVLGTTGSTTSHYYSLIGKAIGYTGGGGAHNNMPPYLAVYIWQRVEDTTES